MPPVLLRPLNKRVCAHIMLPPFQDEKLRKLVEQHGTDSWKSVAHHFPVRIRLSFAFSGPDSCTRRREGRREDERWAGDDVLRLVWPCFRGGQMASVSTAGRRCSTLNW